MSNDESTLTGPEFKQENRKAWKPIPYFCLIYMIVFSIDYFVIFPGYERGVWPDWDRYLAIFIFPAAGFILLLFKHTYGWLVNMFYYVLSSMFLIVDFFVEVYIYKLELNEYRSLAGIILLALSLIILALLQAKAVREYFKIPVSTFRMALIFFIVISIAIIVSIYNS